MRNLLPYNKPCIDVYTEALNKKRVEGIRERLAVITDNIDSRFTEYSSHFISNTLEAVASNGLFHPHSNDLHSLYGYKTKTIREVRNLINSRQNAPITNICQNCTINSVNSMDHVLGQGRYPELSVNPLNLFPSCTECNGFKNASFVKHGTRRFLNLYLDILPQERYLFLNIYREQDGVLNYDFFLQNQNGINVDRFNLINNHYTELELLRRMKQRSILHYSELKNSVRNRLLDLSTAQVIDQIQREAQDNFANLGNNHFKYVMHRELIQHPDFIAEFN